MTKFDLLSTVQYGGCSAKMPAGKLSELLSQISILKDENVLVDIETHDDAGVYKLNSETALIVTTDFFPPICSNAYEFGEIAAANSLSDVYAMGGKPLLVLNLNMFPSATIPLEVLKDILEGGQSKINEAGAITMGGHTIEDAPPKYGLAVVGIVHPGKVITNCGAKVGQTLILTKPLGSGVLVAAQRMGIAHEEAYGEALIQMKLLNKQGSELMQKYGVKSATDITGFGLLGHLRKMAEGSGVSIEINTQALPLLPQVTELMDEGCIPGAAFNNLNFVKDTLTQESTVTLSQKMICCDAQTSGGLLMAVDSDKAQALLAELHATGIHPQASIVGRITAPSQKALHLI